MTNKKLKAFSTLTLFLPLLLTSCLSNDKKVTVNIPEEVTKLSNITYSNPMDYVSENSYFLTKGFIPKNIESKNNPSFLYTTSTPYLVLPLEFTQHSVLNNDNDVLSRIRYAFKNNNPYYDQEYVSLEEYFNLSKANESLFKDDVLDVNLIVDEKLEHGIPTTNLNLQTIINTFEINNALDLLPLALSYIGLNEYIKTNPSNFDLSKFDLDKDNMIDSYFYLPILDNIKLNNNLKMSDKVKEALNSNAFIYDENQAKENKETITKLTGIKFDFTIESFVYQSYFTIRNGDTNYLAGPNSNITCYNNEAIYQTAKLFGMSNYLTSSQTGSSKYKYPISNSFLSSNKKGIMDPLNLISLGFIQPRVINPNSSGKLNIKFQDSFNNTYLIPINSNKRINSIYDEYLILTYYDASNRLIEKDSHLYLEDHVLNKSGVLLFYVDNKLTEFGKGLVDFNDPNLEFDPTSTYSFNKNQPIWNDNNFNSYRYFILEANDNNSIFEKNSMNENDLFTLNTSLFVNTYTNFKFYGDREADFKIYFGENVFNENAIYFYYQLNN